MAESKRDYYEVLGVPKNADDAALKKHIAPLLRNITRTVIQEMQRQRKSLRRRQKHTVCSATRISGVSMTSSVMLLLTGEPEEAALAVLISPGIWATFSVIFSVTFSVEEEAAAASITGL